jgi:hypothetical protein
MNIYNLASLPFVPQIERTETSPSKVEFLFI